MQLDASGRPDESFEVEFIRPLQSGDEDDLKSGQLLFISLQKGKLGASVNIQQSLSASLEVQNFPLDELELASLRGIIQRVSLLLCTFGS